METKIDALEDRISSLRNETKADIAGLNYRFDAIDSKFDSLEKRIPVIEEITALKLKIADIEKRLAEAQT